MIVKSPLKQKKIKPNFPKPAGKRKNGTTPSMKHGNGTPRNYGKPAGSDKKKSSLSFPSLKPWKVILGAITIGALGVLYLSHVFATQQLLREVQQLEQEYNQVKRMHDDYRLTYDRMIGPAEIYEKAKSQGFINGGPAEKVIEVESE